MSEDKIVLNAFRHQRYFHSRRSLCHAQDRRVLNAFRHQRYFHIATWLRHFMVVVLCSTPFGIKGTFTPVMNRSGATHTVLLTCSTPFGIKGTFTKKLSRPMPQSTSAQRLSASKVLSQQCAQLICFIL